MNKLTYPLKLCTRIRNFSSSISQQTVAKVEEFVSPSTEVTTFKKRSVLEPLSEDISHISTYLKPTFNFAAYINKSDTLQELVKLGVNLHLIEKIKDAIPFILKLEFDDIKEHIIFLREQGLDNTIVSDIITRNPFILQENLENLDIRIKYLKSKRFSDEMIQRILEMNAFWLSKSIQEIDERLGKFQQLFALDGNELRSLVTSKPKLVTSDFAKVKLNKFVLKEEMGFTDDEINTIILSRPSILLSGRHKMLKAFEYLHRDMDLSLERIVEEPEILTCRKKRIEERHSFLKTVNKDQYNPKKPHYVSLKQLVSGTDSYFATEIAKSSIQIYNMFLKTL